ncbi:MAG: endonuclease III domain-containing protein [Bacillota bacterium]
MQNEQKFLLMVFQKLLDHYGPRHWWPAETEFEVMVGAVLTQNVAWRNVEKAIAALKEKGLMHPQGLYQADLPLLEELIVPTRYYKTKAKKLKALVELVIDEFGGNLAAMFNQPMQSLRSRLLQVYGIGPETADSILLYAAKKPIFVVDTYTGRIFHRLGVFPANASYQAMQNYFMGNLPHQTELYNEYHALIDCLGHRLCKVSNPGCPLCPLNNICRKENSEKGLSAFYVE